MSDVDINTSEGDVDGRDGTRRDQNAVLSCEPATRDVPQERLAIYPTRPTRRVPRSGRARCRSLWLCRGASLGGSEFDVMSERVQS